VQACDSHWLKVWLSATKSADDDKRSFYGVRVGLKSGAQNLIFHSFDNLFPGITNKNFVH
jgi:hypothetical protein